jgi:hypothetical protein
VARFTKALRQQIVRDFTAAHGGVFDPEQFVREVKNKGESHPAYEWFEWDQSAAAWQYQVEQAREFVRDLRVTFTVEIVGRNQSITVKEMAAPFAISPVGGRRGGGGYIITDPNDPAHMAELARQAASDLEAWLRRYGSVLAHAGSTAAAIERQISALNAVGAETVEAA